VKVWKVGSIVLGLSITYNCIAGIGTITEQTNVPPSIQRSKTVLTGAKGTAVEMMDTVNTTKGKVGITFTDNTRVDVNENSKLLIDDFVYDPKSKDAGKLGVKVALGTVRYASGQIAKNDPTKVAINTPSATIGVRGTDFTMTVDESGASTIILLPSCPYNKIVRDPEQECVTGKIIVSNDAGEVLLDKAFQGTKVESRTTPPTKPVTLKISADSINNFLIVSPPQELRKNENRDTSTRVMQVGDMLAVNYLQQNFLQNEFDKEGVVWDNPLEKPLLQQYFLENIFNLLSDQLAAETKALLENVLAPESQILPDWNKASHVDKSITPISVELCRQDGSSNISCITVPKDQNSTISITQSENVTIKNRVNQGGNTIITTRQN
jgi:FecR protein